MTRITARRIAVQILFSMSANSLSAEETLSLFFSEEHYESLRDEDVIYQEVPDEEQRTYITRVVKLTEEHLSEIDHVISHYSDSWRIERISKTALAILRCALCEILYMEDIPNSASVNEAVELGKTFDTPQAASFINGVLGSFLREQDSERNMA